MPGIVLDPFAGTGTTGMAAREVGRDCILIQAAAEYIDQMQVRLTMGDSEVRRRVKAERESPVIAEYTKRALARVGSRSTLGGGIASQVASKAAQIARGQ